MEKKRAILVIMDGWGEGKVPTADAIAHAKTPFVSSLYKQYPHSNLVTCGEAVGLPEGQMGNSEVGHLNIGAGRIVYQELQRINVAARDGELASNQVLLDTLAHAKNNNKALHLIGLVSDGGVHSHITHLKKLTEIAHQHGLEKVFIHAFTDGRDTDPKSGLGYLEDLSAHLAQTTGKIASVTGRYYAMDRDKRWERVKLAYDALVNATGTPTQDLFTAIKASYAEGVTDEFIKPIIVTDDAQTPLARIEADDAVLCFNFRTDRCREITQVLTQEAFPDFGMQPLHLYYTTMTEYDRTYKNVHVVFENDNLNMTLGEVLAKDGYSQIRIAETEKYPHVSFFFSGGREKEFEGERRLMVPSPKVATYDLQPEMSANEVTDTIVPEIENKTADFICLNFANADMVGHTGVFEAAIKAVETVDHCVERVVTAALASDYTVFLTADHGNADFMINADGTPNTAHTLNLVPLFIINKDFRGTVKDGKLGDIAPTILHFMGLSVPPEMTGNLLV
ncbi:2,3-bisphosphoglycerate-independent phosphoglycerate mutase [Chitinophaga nivalis]|uniref:2,3-bisphosphoglycerate-independent phosphoglycerate mutase n=1 Tax=Chitinophaga nivalis TaxID=2991709 RepID=A0ABT3IUP1_9BACT|nr:2,3-bisphosphoglycerate-independent phosphoglycerate mutase [Chitinophaga nivalis]MCW3462698.1 2,3-bisphosphoglycerate-independent phosphoglycerate mutase [Chitinophaga nivalis]MCW3487611.1 2,3-bisphosphoglycerate-independent phosphoglycerate mutase [Chitinophaga nivalis]